MGQYGTPHARAKWPAEPGHGSCAYLSDMLARRHGWQGTWYSPTVRSRVAARIGYARELDHAADW
jgi:hypothetical protein